MTAHWAWQPRPGPALLMMYRFAWTPPPTASGYYCVRGSVTDTANQLTVVVNPFGIR